MEEGAAKGIRQDGRLPKEYRDMQEDQRTDFRTHLKKVCAKTS